MRILMLFVVFAVALSGCKTSPRSTQYPAPFVDGVNIAVNLGSRHAEDIDKLESALVLEGVPCRRSAMSLNAEQIIVERSTFERAKSVARNAIVRDSLTVR